MSLFLNKLSHPIAIETISGSNSQPEYPTAETILPQFGSSPNTAALNSILLTTAFAASFASSGDLPPSTLTSKNLVSPSPSRAICFASDMQR